MIAAAFPMPFLFSASKLFQPASGSTFRFAAKILLGFFATTAITQAQNVSVAAAGYYHTMFVKTDKTLWATGYNMYGQLGDSTTVAGSRTTAVQITTGVLSVASGFGHTAYIKTDDSLWGMGFNNAGQLGNGLTSFDAQVSAAK